MWFTGSPVSRLSTSASNRRRCAADAVLSVISPSPSMSTFSAWASRTSASHRASPACQCSMLRDASMRFSASESRSAEVVRTLDRAETAPRLATLDIPRMVAEQDNPPRRGAAFFDVDRTLLRGSSLLHVARPMRREGLLSTRAMLHSLIVQARFSLAGFNEVQIHDAVRGAGDIVTGVDVERLIRFARHVMPLYVAPLVFDEALRRISWHRGRGDLVFLVSSSPVAFIAVLGEVLGVDGVTATEAEVREAAEANHIDLAVSYAYGDSFASDLRMLEAVGHPVCVNGDRLLTAHARQLGWPVERFEHIGGGVAATSLRRLARRVVTMSRPAMRRAGLHVRNTARALREL